MKKNILTLLTCFICGGVYAADWVYVTSSSSEDFYIDKSFYNYDQNKKSVDLWVKSEAKSTIKNGEYYTSSKFLTRYSCLDKKSKFLAGIDYNSDGSVKGSTSVQDKNFKMVFPDTVGEDLWKAACDSKGKGLKVKDYRPELVPPEKVRELFPNGPYGN